ncbi:hypothetical protein GCM10009764_74230 [Nocardia ninae]|uniref:Uncharacterized protein n=1 Tax=Nocardia ninae NBRC 108245 TaxID=1210091 RepID=A0A511MKJ8_9NOCA|nr:hypothetical protein NN4_56740 [Nocardia ninae NBRC 108245]
MFEALLCIHDIESDTRGIKMCLQMCVQIVARVRTADPTGDADSSVRWVAQRFSVRRRSDVG